MKVLYDHQIFSSQRYGGISRYFCELMRHYEQTNACQFEVGAMLSNNAYISSLESPRLSPFFPSVKFKGQAKIMYAMNQLVTNRALQKPDINVVHPTYYDPYILKSTKKPFVLTCHDLINERIGDSSGKLTDSSRKVKEPLLAGAAAIIAVSENTKRDIVELYNIPESRIEVIHLASSLTSTLAPDTLTISIPDNYLLFVGNRDLYKNFRQYLKAIAPLLLQHKDIKLVCAGGGAFSSEEKALFHELKLGESVLHFAINDSLLAALYQHALGLVFPSLYEGFGIPLLEAFSCGCPVIASQVSSLPEVAGDAALYFEPTSLASMREATQQIIEDETLRKKLVIAGQNRIKAFSWAKTAEKTLAVYKSLT